MGADLIPERMVVVVSGSPIDGARLWGPFGQADDALEWAEATDWNDDPWWIASIEPAL